MFSWCYLLKIVEWVVNSEDPDQTPRSASSDLSLYCFHWPVLPDAEIKYLQIIWFVWRFFFIFYLFIYFFSCGGLIVFGKTDELAGRFPPKQRVPQKVSAHKSNKLFIFYCIHLHLFSFSTNSATVSEKKSIRQSTPVISNSKGFYETLRDIHTMTYQIRGTEENKSNKPHLTNEYVIWLLKIEI